MWIWIYMHVYVYDPCVDAGEAALREVPLEGCGLAHAPEEGGRRCFALNTPQVPVPSSPPIYIYLFIYLSICLYIYVYMYI